MKKDKNSKIKILIIGIILIIIIGLVALISILIKPKQSSAPIEITEQTEQKIQKQLSDAELKSLTKMTEEERIKHYATKFLKLLQSRDCETAYNLLNKGFKGNYFPNKTSFETYVKKYIPKEMDVKYKNFERLNNIYVLDVKIGDVLNYSNPNNFDFYVVIKENNFDDYEVSFSMDRPMQNSGETFDESSKEIVSSTSDVEDDSSTEEEE